jgi:hypothetical protein
MLVTNTQAEPRKSGRITLNVPTLSLREANPPADCRWFDALGDCPADARSAHSSARKQTSAADFFHGCDCCAGLHYVPRYDGRLALECVRLGVYCWFALSASMLSRFVSVGKLPPT